MHLAPGVFLFLFFWVVLGLELKAYTLSHSTGPVLWIGSHDLFAQTGLKL
jgi:hypothetical protein